MPTIASFGDVPTAFEHALTDSLALACSKTTIDRWGSGNDWHSKLTTRPVRRKLVASRCTKNVASCIVVIIGTIDTIDLSDDETNDNTNTIDNGSAMNTCLRWSPVEDRMSRATVRPSREVIILPHDK